MNTYPKEPTAKRLLFHIGVPKSATTSLQFAIFPSHPEVRYLGKPFYDETFGYSGSKATADLIDSLWKEDSLVFDITKASNLFQAGIQPRLGEKHISIVSEEGLAHAGAADRGLIAERIQQVSLDTDCRILLTIRNPTQALRSLHQWYYARRMISQSFEEWVNWCNSYSTYHGCLNDFPLREYRYTGLVKRYIELFGAEKVLVLPMEQLSSNAKAFFSQLEDFCGIRPHWSRRDALTAVENPSPGNLCISYQRSIKWLEQLQAKIRGVPYTPSETLNCQGFNASMMNLLARLDSPQRGPTPAMTSWLNNYYREDNRELSKITGLDLGALGYSC